MGDRAGGAPALGQGRPGAAARLSHNNTARLDRRMSAAWTPETTVRVNGSFRRPTNCEVAFSRTAHQMQVSFLHAFDTPEGTAVLTVSPREHNHAAHPVALSPPSLCRLLRLLLLLCLLPITNCLSLLPR